MSKAALAPEPPVSEEKFEGILTDLLREGRQLEGRTYVIIGHARFLRQYVEKPVVIQTLGRLEEPFPDGAEPYID